MERFGIRLKDFLTYKCVDVSQATDPYTAGGTGADVCEITISTSGSSAYNNIPPYLVVYMWKKNCIKI